MNKVEELEKGKIYSYSYISECANKEMYIVVFNHEYQTENACCKYIIDDIKEIGSGAVPQAPDAYRVNSDGNYEKIYGLLNGAFKKIIFVTRNIE